MKTIYTITRFFTIIFCLIQEILSTLAFLVMFVPIFFSTILQLHPNLLWLSLLELGIYIIPMAIIIYKLMKNQKVGWIIGIITSAVWLTLSFVFANGKPELMMLPIFNLPLSILGLATYRNKK